MLITKRGLQVCVCVLSNRFQWLRQKKIKIRQPAVVCSGMKICRLPRLALCTSPIHRSSTLVSTEFRRVQNFSGHPHLLSVHGDARYMARVKPRFDSAKHLCQLYNVRFMGENLFENWARESIPV